MTTKSLAATRNFIFLLWVGPDQIHPIIKMSTSLFIWYIIYFLILEIVAAEAPTHSLAPRFALASLLKLVTKTENQHRKVVHAKPHSLILLGLRSPGSVYVTFNGLTQ